MSEIKEPGIVFLAVFAMLIAVSGCASDPVKNLKDRFNILIDRLAAVEVEGEQVRDYKMFYRHCEDILAEYRDSEYAVDRLKDLLLTCESFAVRGGAAVLLGQMGTIKDLLPLITALKDGNSFVREKALKGLKEITHEDFGYDKDRWMKWWNEKENTNDE